MCNLFLELCTWEREESVREREEEERRWIDETIDVNERSSGYTIITTIEVHWSVSLCICYHALALWLTYYWKLQQSKNILWSNNTSDSSRTNDTIAAQVKRMLQWNNWLTLQRDQHFSWTLDNLSHQLLDNEGPPSVVSTIARRIENCLSMTWATNRAVEGE